MASTMASRESDGVAPAVSVRRRPRSLGWYAAVAAGVIFLVFGAGGGVTVFLIRRGGGPGSAARGAGALLLLLALAGATLGGLFLWLRTRLAGDLGRLVRLVERADPEGGEPTALSPLRVAEYERLRLAVHEFFPRLRASRARQEEVEETLGYVVEHAGDAILVLDREHRILSWSPGGEEIFGFAPREMTGAPYAIFTPGGEEEAELVAPLAPGARVRDFRTRRLRSDGRQLDVSITRSRVPVPAGGEDRFVEIVRDVSATRRLEEDLLRSEKMAAVGKISSKVVHEIRNPLASIILNVDLLRESLDEPGSVPEAETRETLDVIKREVRRLSQITEEYLQFSRLPRAAFRSERVNDIVVELADFVRPLIARKGVQLVLTLDEADPEAICDATLLRQALLNLLRNAVDAVDEDTGRIQVSTRALDDGEADPAGGRSVEISVEDDGCGIPEELRERIFEPFFTTKRDGTGLGLALVRRAVEEHGGQIRCVSLPGKGTAFRVRIGRASAGHLPPGPRDLQTPGRQEV
jgi:PAS domain S-box-containing protein